MRKSKKQMTALMPVMGMTVVGSMIGYTELAAEPSDVVMNGIQVTSDGGDSMSKLIDQIDATSLSVTPSLRVGFSIDPTTYMENNITTQAGERQPREYKIIDSSAVPVYIYISAVGMNKDKDGSPYTGGVTDMSLVTTREGLATAHSVILAVKGATVSTARAKPGTGDTGFWLEEKAAADNYKYMLSSSKGKVDARSGVNGTIMSPKVCGLIQTGWNHRDRSAVTLTFMVTTMVPQIPQEI